MSASLAFADAATATAGLAIDAAGRGQIVTFRVGDAGFGVDIRSVREIRAWSPTTALPNAPAFVRGVVNLRGLIVPIFDLRARFGQGQTEPSPAHVVIVVGVGARTVGVLVDAVSDIVPVAEGDIKPIPAIDGATVNECLDGLVTIGEEMIAVVSVERVITSAAIQ